MRIMLKTNAYRAWEKSVNETFAELYYAGRKSKCVNVVNSVNATLTGVDKEMQNTKIIALMHLVGDEMKVLGFDKDVIVDLMEHAQECLDNIAEEV